MNREEIIKNKKNLQGADLRGVDLQGAYLRGANLQGSDLQGAYLLGANLQETNLQGANLQRANLQRANLQEADLRGVDLQGANLQGANLRGADLLGVDLLGANLQGANLRGANLSQVKTLPLQDHNFLSEILFRKAKTTEQRMWAGLIRISTDWCKKEFTREFSPEAKKWIFSILGKWEEFTKEYSALKHFFKERKGKNEEKERSKRG